MITMEFFLLTNFIFFGVLYTHYIYIYSDILTYTYVRLSEPNYECHDAYPSFILLLPA